MLYLSIFASIYKGSTIIYPISGAPSAAMVVDCLRHTKVSAVCTPPPVIEEIGRNPEILDLVSQKMQCLFYAGGDVSSAAGDAISCKMKLITTCGATETGMWPTIYPSGAWDNSRWHYMHIHPAANVAFRHRSDDLYEAILVRNSDPEEEQSVFKLPQLRGLHEYATRDLFSPHPSDPTLWRHRGRTDDLQVFITGGKYHPVAVEQLISSHPDVQEALLVGTRRESAALLLEMCIGVPLETAEQRTKVLQRVWPFIEKANEMCPDYAVIARERVVFTQASVPMLRTAKGTVARKATVEAYNVELNAV